MTVFLSAIPPHLRSWDIIDLVCPFQMCVTPGTAVIAPPGAPGHLSVMTGLLPSS